MGIGLIKTEQGKALIRTRVGDEVPQVFFNGSWVWPMIHQVEIMDITAKIIKIERSGSDGLICRNKIRADTKVAFFVRVNRTVEDVIKVAQIFGCERASNQDHLEALFAAKFSEALKTAAKQLDFEDLYTQRDKLRDLILVEIGTDLNGYILEDCTIDYFEQTPLTKLDDEHNIVAPKTST